MSHDPWFTTNLNVAVQQHPTAANRGEAKPELYLLEFWAEDRGSDVLCMQFDQAKSIAVENQF